MRWTKRHYFLAWLGTALLLAALFVGVRDGRYRAVTDPAVSITIAAVVLLILVGFVSLLRKRRRATR
jgi:ABC-type nickel/cobalt efflux system permease component RcnA